MRIFEIYIGMAVIIVLPRVSFAGDVNPEHLWPIANTSLYHDVVGLGDIHHDPDDDCFSFVEGPPGFPFSVLDMSHEPDTCYDVTIAGTSRLRDLSISMHVYPNNDADTTTGTLLHYQSDDREILRMRTLQNTFLVSFRDEYGMSAGTMYIVNFFTPRQWTHVLLTRTYSTGRIVVYKDGVEVYNEDDEFSDVISFPFSGQIRLGKSQNPDDEDQFEGNFACVQLYNKRLQPHAVSRAVELCTSPNWESTYAFYYKKVNDELCLSTPPKPQVVGPVVTMTTLTREPLWEAFIEKHGLQDSGKTIEKLTLQSRDKRPVLSDNLIGVFNSTGKSVCARLCMRVDNCAALLLGTSQYSVDLNECTLYNDVPTAFNDDAGTKVYVIDD